MNNIQNQHWGPLLDQYNAQISKQLGHAAKERFWVQFYNGLVFLSRTNCEQRLGDRLKEQDYGNE